MQSVNFKLQFYTLHLLKFADMSGIFGALTVPASPEKGNGNSGGSTSDHAIEYPLSITVRLSAGIENSERISLRNNSHRPTPYGEGRYDIWSS